MKITVSRAFCGRRVITVDGDDRTYSAKEVASGWTVYNKEGPFCTVRLVRDIERAVYNHIKSYE